MIALKRMATGLLELVFGVVLVVSAVRHGGTPSPLLVFALVLFFGGGVWTLRDGLRVRRELQRTNEVPAR
jgi:hypothetical protein